MFRVADLNFKIKKDNYSSTTQSSFVDCNFSHNYGAGPLGRIWIFRKNSVNIQIIAARAQYFHF